MGKPQTKSAKQTKSDAFIDDAVLSGGQSSYFKPEAGDNEIRIISKPIFGWVAWAEDKEGNKKPERFSLDNEPDKDDYDKKNPPKKFMALVIVDLVDEETKIWECTQQSVIKGVKALAANPKWGDPFTYDITIGKTGEDLKTKYTVTPSPKAPLSKELMRAANEKPCNLSALFEGKDPWNEENHDEVTEYHFK
jgi:hypothetical protein